MKHQPPNHLDEQSRAKWSEVFPVLETRGDLDAGTLDALACYCVAYSQWKAATAKVDELGQVIRSAAGFAVVSPYVQVAAAAERRMRQWAAELKLTPKSRGRKAESGEESAVSKILRVMDQQEATA